jgi:hypothetical protein
LVKEVAQIKRIHRLSILFMSLACVPLSPGMQKGAFEKSMDLMFDQMNECNVRMNLLPYTVRPTQAPCETH